MSLSRCPDDETVMMEGNGKGTSNFFSFNMFEFTRKNNEVYLHCKLELCPKQSNSCAPVSRKYFLDWIKVAIKTLCDKEKFCIIQKLYYGKEKRGQLYFKKWKCYFCRMVDYNIFVYNSSGSWLVLSMRLKPATMQLSALWAVVVQSIGYLRSLLISFN